MLPTIGSRPELVPKPDPVAKSWRYEAQVALPRRGACQRLGVTDNSPPGQPAVGRSLQGVGERTAPARLSGRCHDGVRTGDSDHVREQWRYGSSRPKGLSPVVRDHDERLVRNPLGQALHDDCALRTAAGVISVDLVGSVPPARVDSFAPA